MASVGSSTGHEDAHLIVSSQKLADRAGLKCITVLLVLDENILHETLERLPLSRVTVPARLLETSASITIHLAICDANGVADVLDSGQVLVLPPGPANELQQVYQQMTLDVQDSFYSPNAELPQPERYRQHPTAWSHLLPVPNGLPADPATAAAAAHAEAQDTPDSSLNSVRSASIEEARRAAVYAYQHLLLPVIHLMSAVLQGAAAHRDGSSSPRETAALQSIARRLLDFLVDNDMFESATFFMGQLPFAPEHAMGPRLQLLNSLGARSSIRALILQQPLQQQLLTLQIAQQHTAETLRELQRRSSMFPVLNMQEQQQQRTPSSSAAAAAGAGGSVQVMQQRSSDASSMASADEILRQLGVLEHARGEQEALESELLLQEEQEALESGIILQQQQQWQQQPDPASQQSAAAAADQVPLHRCSSLPWSLHSRQKGPGQPDRPGQQGHGLAELGSSDDTLEGLGLPTSDLWNLGLGQQQQQRSRAIPDDLEGYLQPHPSFVRRSAPPQAPAAAAAGKRSGSLDLNLYHQQHVLVPMLSGPQASAAAAAADCAVEQRQHEGIESLHSALGAAAASHGRHLQLQQQQQLPMFASIEMPPSQQQQQQVDYNMPAVEPTMQEQQMPASAASALAAVQKQQQVPHQAVTSALRQQQQHGPVAGSPAAAADSSFGMNNDKQQQQQLAVSGKAGRNAGAADPAVAGTGGAAGGSSLGSSEGLLRQGAVPYQQKDSSTSWCHSAAASARGGGCGGCGGGGGGGYEPASLQQVKASSNELHKLQQVPCDCGCKNSSSSSSSSILKASEYKAAVPDAASCRPPPQQQQQPGLYSSSYSTCSSSKQQQQLDVSSSSLQQQFHSLLGVSLTGFADHHVEQAYLTFKNHSCGLLDSTAAVMCLGMLLASICRSFNPQRDPLAWQKLAVLIIYGLFFFFPYGLMQVRKQLFIRWREPLIVWARVSSSCVQVLIGLGILARPDAWVAAVGMFVALQLQDGFILPSCQQVRMPAAAAVAAAQLVADACMLQMMYAPWVAVLQAASIQACALVVGLWLDAWGRKRFMLRFRGMFG